MTAILAAATNAPAIVNLNAYRADPTGAAFSDAAMSAAQAAGGSSYVITARPGTYKFANSYQFGPGQGIATGQDNLAVIFQYTGSGVFITSHDPAFNTSSATPLQSICGPQTGYTIDGTSAGAGAVAIRIGDQNLPDVNIGARNFSGAGSIGAWLDNQVGWTNNGQVTVSTDNCTNQVVFDNSGGTASFGAVSFTFYQEVKPNQNGVAVKNSCMIVGGSFQVFGEYLAGSSNTGTVLSVGADGSSAALRGQLLSVNVECTNGGGTVGPVTVNMGASGFFGQNTGQLIFRNTTGSFQVSTGIQFTYRFSFSGIVSCDTAGDYLVNVANNGVGLVTYGSALQTQGSTDSTHIYNGTGNMFSITLASGANTLAVANPVAGVYQDMLLEVKQPASGAAGTLTITSAKTPNGSGALTLSAANNAVDVVKVWYDGFSVYASVLGLNYH